MRKARRRRGDAHRGRDRAPGLLKRDPGDDRIEASGSNAEPVPETDGFGDDEYVPVLEPTAPVESVLAWDVILQEQIRIVELLRKHSPTDEAKHDELVSAPSMITREALKVFHPIVLHHLLTLDGGSEVVRPLRGAKLREEHKAAEARAQDAKRREQASGAALDEVADLDLRSEYELEGEGEERRDDQACLVRGDEPIDRAIAEMDKDTLTRRHPRDPTWRQRTLDQLSAKQPSTVLPDDGRVCGLINLQLNFASKQAAHRREWSLARFSAAHLRANYDAIGAGKRPSKAESAIITLRLVALVDGLRAAEWTMERVAALIIASVDDWGRPPCPDLVAQWCKGKRGAELAGTAWVEKRRQRAR